jgi:hypothetical protein
MDGWGNCDEKKVKNKQREQEKKESKDYCDFGYRIGTMQPIDDQ